MSWLEVSSVLVIALTSLFVSECEPSEMVAIQTIHLTPSPRSAVEALPAPTGSPSPMLTSRTTAPSPIPTGSTATPSAMPTSSIATASPTPVSTATACPSPPVASPTPLPEPTSTGRPEGVAITIVYDNNQYDERPVTAWGSPVWSSELISL